VLLGGIPGIWIAAACLLTVAGVLSPAGGLALAALMLVPYIGLLALRRSWTERLPLPGSWTTWLVSAVHEEETELVEAIRPVPGSWRDGLVAAVALISVVAASITMEQAATALGHRYAVADIIIGGLVLAVVTSLPNAVSAVYLARRGRGAAVLSTALNSNAINVAAGLLIPASLAELGGPRRAGLAGRRLVRGPDHPSAGTGLARPGTEPPARGADHRRLPRVHGSAGNQRGTAGGQPAHRRSPRRRHRCGRGRAARLAGPDQETGGRWRRES